MILLVAGFIDLPYPLFIGFIVDFISKLGYEILKIVRLILFYAGKHIVLGRPLVIKPVIVAVIEGKAVLLSFPGKGDQVLLMP